MKNSIFYLILLPLFYSSCKREEPYMFNNQSSRIVYGTPDTSTAHQAVVYIQSNNNAACTGTVIAPSWVLTAGHCVEGATASDIYFGDNVNAFYDSRQVDQIIRHPNYVGTDQNVYNDICLMHMASPAPNNITPIPALPASLAINSNDEGSLSLEFSGYGLDENGASGVREHVSSTLVAECSITGNYCNIGNTMPYQIPPGSISYLETPGGPCSGDSGGPAFIMRNGTQYVAGVTSYGDQNCTQYGVSTKVDYFESWINSYVGGTTSENCTNNIDDDGDGDIDCNDSDCSASPACVESACTNPQTVSCGDTVSGNTSTGSSLFSTNACINQFTEDGPENAWVLDVPASADVTISLTPSNSNSDLDIYLLSQSCDPDSCENGSATDGNAAESFNFTAAASTNYFLLVETYQNPGAYSLSVTCSGVTNPENCTNGVDDDGDGNIDCNDSDCSSNSACQTQSENCTNGVDDDGDGNIDCNDSDCMNDSACITQNENCTNGIDDDNDGLVDCDDADCSTLSSCTSLVEICDNGVDDDNDGATDCADVDCATAAGCSTNFNEICDNGIDDDNDGKIDCNDSDCITFLSCKAPKEICDNNRDDDGDGSADCDDADCLSFYLCSSQGRELCGNGADDDHDGYTDCDDADCASYTACNSWNPDGGVDNGCSCKSAGSNGSIPTTLLILLGFSFFLYRRKFFIL